MSDNGNKIGPEVWRHGSWILRRRDREDVPIYIGRLIGDDEHLAGNVHADGEIKWREGWEAPLAVEWAALDAAEAPCGHATKHRKAIIEDGSGYTVCNKDDCDTVIKTWDPNIDAMEYLANYPMLCAHIICESLGYASPKKAAIILRDADRRCSNYCEWIYSCYKSNPLRAVRVAIKNRDYHKGYMAEIEKAKTLIKHDLEALQETGRTPNRLAAWF